MEVHNIVGIIYICIGVLYNMLIIPNLHTYIHILTGILYFFIGFIYLNEESFQDFINKIFNNTTDSNNTEESTESKVDTVTDILNSDNDEQIDTVNKKKLDNKNESIIQKMNNNNLKVDAYESFSNFNTRYSSFNF